MKIFYAGVIQGINFTVCSTAGVLPCILFDYLYHRYVSIAFTQLTIPREIIVGNKKIISIIIVNIRLQDTLQMWDNMFLVNALLNLIAGILFLIFASSELQSWNFRSSSSDVEDRRLMSIEENGKPSATVRLRSTTSIS